MGRLPPPVTAAWLREVLVRHDPLGAWKPDLAGSDYVGEASLAAAALHRIHGVAHAWDVVADALDRVHPGFYAAARRDEAEIMSRLGMIARETWDYGGSAIPPPRPPLAKIPGSPPAPPARLTDEVALVHWLRDMEARLEVDAEEHVRESRTVGRGLRTAFPGLTLAYGAASAEQREGMRNAVSRFRMVRYELSGFIGMQFRNVRNTGSAEALRLALLAESLLDMGLDWRDELLLLRDLRSAALRAGLPFAELLEEAIACSSPAAARFLRDFGNEES